MALPFPVTTCTNIWRYLSLLQHVLTYGVTFSLLQHVLTYGVTFSLLQHVLTYGVTFSLNTLLRSFPYSHLLSPILFHATSAEENLTEKASCFLFCFGLVWFVVCCCCCFIVVVVLISSVRFTNCSNFIARRLKTCQKTRCREPVVARCI